METPWFFDVQEVFLKKEQIEQCLLNKNMKQNCFSQKSLRAFVEPPPLVRVRSWCHIEFISELKGIFFNPFFSKIDSFVYSDTVFVNRSLRIFLFLQMLCFQRGLAWSFEARGLEKEKVWLLEMMQPRTTTSWDLKSARCFIVNASFHKLLDLKITKVLMPNTSLLDCKKNWRDPIAEWLARQLTVRFVRGSNPSGAPKIVQILQFTRQKGYFLIYKCCW